MRDGAGRVVGRRGSRREAGHEADAGRKHVLPSPRHWIEPPDEHRLVDQMTQSGEDEDDGLVGERRSSLAAVHEVHVNGQTHGRACTLPPARTLRPSVRARRTERAPGDCGATSTLFNAWSTDVDWKALQGNAFRWSPKPPR